MIKNQRIKVELTIDAAITNISGHLTTLITNKSTIEFGKLLKSEYDNLLKKFREITSDEYRKKLSLTRGLNIKFYLSK